MSVFTFSIKPHLGTSLILIPVFFRHIANHRISTSPHASLPRRTFLAHLPSSQPSAIFLETQSAKSRTRDPCCRPTSPTNYRRAATARLGRRAPHTHAHQFAAARARTAVALPGCLALVWHLVPSGTCFPSTGPRDLHTPRVHWFYIISSHRPDMYPVFPCPLTPAPLLSCQPASVASTAVVVANLSSAPVPARAPHIPRLHSGSHAYSIPP